MGIGPTRAGRVLAARLSLLSDRFIPFATRLQVPEREVTVTGLEGGAWLLYPSRAYLPRQVRVVADFLKAEITGL